MMYGQASFTSQVMNNALIMDLLGSFSAGDSVPAFENRPEALVYRGSTATVIMDKTNASVRVFCRGQEISVYDSLHPEDCKNPQFADELGKEAMAEMTRDLHCQITLERKRMVSKIARRPY